MKNYTITVFSENKPGVLYRIADMFVRRKVNVESLTVSEIEQKGISRFTIVVQADKEQIDNIVKQLYKIIEITKVFESTDAELVHKELAFIKVSTKTPERRKEVEDLTYLFRAKVAHVNANSIVIEKTGTEEEINSMFTLLKPFGIKEFVRSGRIAVLKDEGKTETLVESVTKEASNVAMSLDMSAIKKVQLISNNTPGSISLAQGIPSFFTPKHIKQAAKDAIDANLSDKYTPSFGILELRDAISKKLQRDNNIKADSSQIIVTHGATEAVMSVFMSLFNPGDEMIILTPDYASHITQARISRQGARPILVPLRETEKGWVLDPERIEASITTNTKAILICNPCNPTGKVYTEAELKEIARIAIKHNLFIITDEMYEYFVFGGKKHISIGSFPEVADRTISIFGVSKSYSMTGWRIGYVVASKALTQYILKINDALITSPTAVSQYAALAALKGSKDAVKEFKAGFEKRRKIVIDALKKTDKVSFIPPDGGYYIFPRINKDIDDYDFALQMIKDGKVAVVPGSAFGLGGENHIRISFGGEDDQVKEGMKRFVKYVEENL